MSEFVYNKASGYEFDVQFNKLIKYARLIFNNPHISLGKENLDRLDKFYSPYEKTKSTHFENCTKFYMEQFHLFYQENKSFFKHDISFSTRKAWLTNEDVQIVIKGDKSSKILSISNIYRTALHISELNSSMSVTDETVLYPSIVLLHLLRILKLVSNQEDREEREVLTTDIKSLSTELGLEKESVTASTSRPAAPKNMNFADIFNAQNIGMIETAIKAITSNDKFNNIMQNLNAKDTPDNGNLSTAELTTGVLEIMNAMKSEIPSILSNITPVPKNENNE